LVAQWHRYLLFDISTSLGWDTGRAITNVLAILLAGPAMLAVFRRAARRASFMPDIAFAAADTINPAVDPAMGAAASAEATASRCQRASTSSPTDQHQHLRDG
jgi:energy-coupling factor transport system substrate-specific component